MKKKIPLVTILTPAYNVGNKVRNYFESIKNQNYRPIEVIIVNDGSTDNTEQVVQSYFKQFRESNIKTKYIFQSNKGVCGAINTGLKAVKGDFLTWPDADDFLSPRSIEKKVNFLLKNKSVGVVTTDANIFKENNLKESLGLLSKNYPRIMEENQFELLLLENSIFCPGCHMVRFNLLKKVCPNLEIFESRIGQNWQLLLPLYYSFKHGYLDEPLFNYIIYSDSISHSNNATFAGRLFKIREKEKILINTLRRIAMNKKDYYKYVKMIKNKYSNERKLIYKEIMEKLVKKGKNKY